jgi:arylsulfatase A
VPVGPTTRTAPNIVLVVADDLAFGDLGVYGSPLIKTPHVDALGRRGLVCDEMYAPAVGDTPSRCGILTGRYGARYGLPESTSPGSAGLPPRAVTMATLLRGAGYTTGLFGQWRLGSRAGETPSDHGFGRFRGSYHGVNVSPVVWQEDGTVVDANFDAALVARDITEHALEFTGEHADGPVLAVLAHLAPHIPYRAEPTFFGRSAAGEYGDVVEQIDHYLGVLLAGLRSQQGTHDRPTLVIFTSDNGPRYEGYVHQRRGRKPEVFDGGVRVPFVAAWLTGSTQTRDSVPRSLVDITPSLCALAGVAPPSNLDGVDLSPLFHGQPTPARGPVYLWSGSWLNAVRDANWKLHVAQGAPASLTALDNAQYWPMLFNYDDDFREAYSVADYHPEIVDAISAQLRRVQLDVAAEAATGRE